MRAGCGSAAASRRLRHLSVTCHAPGRPVPTRWRPQQQRPAIAASSRASQPLTGHHHLDRDEEKERARKYRRPVFDHDLWAAHRSTRRYWRHTKGLVTSRIVWGLGGPLAYVGLISLLVSGYEGALEAGALPPGWPSIAVEVAGPFSISTFALSLLLVFRTNASYNRFNEARKLWGSCINRSRDIARQACQWVAPVDAGLAAALCRWTAAFPLALMAALREDVGLDAELLGGVLWPDEVQLVLRQPHPGSAVLQAMGACVRASGAKDIEKLRIDESISSLQDVQGGCERIFRTPIPLSYTRHTSRFLVVWLTCLPFVVERTLGWATVPVTCVMAFFLFGIEEIGVQLEEPFGVLALESFCQVVVANVAQAQAAAAAAGEIAERAADEAGWAEREGAALPPVMSPGGAGARRSGGYTLPRPPAAVSNVLMVSGDEEVEQPPFSPATTVGAFHLSDDSDAL